MHTVFRLGLMESTAFHHFAAFFGCNEGELGGGEQKRAGNEIMDGDIFKMLCYIVNQSHIPENHCNIYK